MSSAFRKTLGLSKPSDWSASGQNAYDYVYNLSSAIGVRLGGSPGETKAAEYVRDLFKGFGLRAWLQKYPIWTYGNSAMKAAVSLDGKTFKEIPCEAAMPCKSTPKAGLTAPVFVAVNGYQKALTPEVKGKIVLMSHGVPKEERERFLSYKPAAIVMVDGRYEPFLHRNLAGHDYFANWGAITTCTIDYQEALPILDRPQGSVIMRLDIQNTEKYVWGHNVIGEIKGTEAPNEIVVICGHYDSHWNCPGATDNAGGSAVVMELARILASKKPRRTLRFVLFGGEESGLHGSIAYAHALYEDDKKRKEKKGFNHVSGHTLLDDHRLCFNIDVMGAPVANNVMLYSGPEDLGASMRLFMQEMELHCYSKAEPMSSDGTPFGAIGVPTLQYGRYGAATCFGHSAFDSVKFLSPQAMQLSCDLCLGWLKRYVMDMKSFPFKHEVPDEHVKACDNYFQGRRGRNPRFTTEELFPCGLPKAKDAGTLDIK